MRDTQTLHSPAWLRFVCFEGAGLYLAELNTGKRKHRAHMHPALGKYEVFLFDARHAYSANCMACGAPGAELHYSGESDQLYIGDDLEAAAAVFEEAERELRAVAVG